MGNQMPNTMKKLLLFIVSLFAFLAASAQSISVKSFQLLEGDMTTTSLEGKRTDQNGEVAALIKVVTTERNFSFEGGTLGILDTQQRKGEVWVWVPRGLRKITILHDQLGVLRNYSFPVEIMAERTYEMVLTTAKIETIVKEEVRQQYLVFQLSPKDAVLEVDDQLWTVSGEGTARRFVNFGTYTYRVQAPNYYPEAGKVTVDDPNNKKTVSVTLRPNFGWIEVKGSGLQDAAVYVDNALIGKAPCKSGALKSGEHMVRIAKEMYAPYSERVTVRDNETTTLSPTLTADFARVTLTVDGDAEIWVNDEKKGIRSWTGNLASGTYRMECRLASHESSVVTKEITNTMEGQTITLPAPKPIYGSLNVESTPDFAQIYIDGKPMGQTPDFISQILVGSHQLKLTKEGYVDYKETITIAKDEHKQVQATMNKGAEAPSAAKPQSQVPTGAINGLFSVSATQQVYFSQGNLQYVGGKDDVHIVSTWKFADHQWDVIGEGQGNSSQGTTRDLFGWGTSGYNHGAVCYQPWSTSTSYSDYYAYGQYTYNLYDQTGQADWGYNAISNGGNQENSGWRTLTHEEWGYVFNTRSTSSGIRFAKANVNNVNGVILLPDNWSTSYYALNSTNSGGASFTTNTISSSQWNTLEQHGAVFLPAAGYRYGTSVYVVGSFGYYWSASYSNSNYGAWYVNFYDSGLRAGGYYDRNDGFSVRLVRSVQ